jgi:hypothetical protein
MAHNPVNHPLRPMYRVVGFLAGAYLIAFAIVGLIQTSGESFTGSTGVRVLGQGSNMLWSLVTLALGAIIVIAAAVGRNLDTTADKFLGYGLLVAGTYELAFSRTDANIFGFTISTVIVTYLVGTALITASLYSKVAPPSQAGAPRQVREGRTA